MPITTFSHDQSLARAGRVFDVSVFFNTGNELANLATCDILVITGPTGFHAGVSTKAIGTMEIYGYYDTVVSDNGLELTPFNRNPGVAARDEYTPAVKFYHQPVVTNVGTLMYDDLLPAGLTQGNTSSGASADAGVGYYLESNKTYLLRIKNVSGAAAVMHHAITGHEAL